MDQTTHNDQPIGLPSEDQFGIDPFARALAGSLQKLKSPNGSVIALNGPWGSGKSSAVNLIRHHLADAVEREEIVVIDFACWWFRGEDALALAFFRELYAGMSPSIGEKLKKSLPKLGARLLRAGSVVSSAADLAGAAGAGSLVGGAMDWLSGMIQQEESVEKLHAELSKALADQKRRFLVVIDDIDRLSPDEALLIFRLVKSVGRLPNVMYLLVYDRQLAEKIVSERFPSEGPHYLEKIVQAAFELPEPLASDIHNHLLRQIDALCGAPDERRIVRFMNLFYEGVVPEMRTPRDVTRFVNSLSVTWPAVAGEVDMADFVLLEVFRLLHPEIYRAVRRSKDKLAKTASRDGNRQALAEEYERLFLHSIADAERTRYKRALMRLFPLLESVWGNMSYSGDFGVAWAGDRRVCSSSHFDSYFRFSIGDEVLLASELDSLVKRAGDSLLVASELRAAVSVQRQSGGTKASVILSELTVHATKVAVQDIAGLVTGLFEVADDLDVTADHVRGFGIGDNSLRIHWLIRALTRDRMTLQERSEVYVAACRTASLGWLADFADSAWMDYHPRQGSDPETQDQCLTTEADATALRAALLGRIEAEAARGALRDSRSLARLLFSWSEIAGDGGAAVKEWTRGQIETDVGVEALASAFTSESWSQSLGISGLGDLVSKRSTRAQVEGLDRLLDVAAFRRRVEEVAGAGTSPKVKDFLDAWVRREVSGRD